MRSRGSFAAAASFPLRLPRSSYPPGTLTACSIAFQHKKDLSDGRCACSPPSPYHRPESAPNASSPPPPTRLHACNAQSVARRTTKLTNDSIAARKRPADGLLEVEGVQGAGRGGAQPSTVFVHIGGQGVAGDEREGAELEDNQLSVLDTLCWGRPGPSGFHITGIEGSGL
ncbi:hypothetical protein V8D89_001081 [Ganoderma adspersum]